LLTSTKRRLLRLGVKLENRKGLTEPYLVAESFGDYIYGVKAGVSIDLEMRSAYGSLAAE